MIKASIQMSKYFFNINIDFSFIKGIQMKAYNFQKWIQKVDKKDFTIIKRHNQTDFFLIASVLVL